MAIFRVPSAEMLKIAAERGVITRCGVGEDLPFWEALERIGKGTNNELVIVPYEALGTSSVTSAINRRTLRGTAHK